jgi:tetratricopeptide (TPR) repeat protein
MVRICFIAFLALTTSINVFAGKRAPKRLIRMGERLLDQSHDDSIYILGKYFVEKYPEDPKTKWVIRSAATKATYSADYAWAEKAFNILLHTPDPKMDKDFQPEGYSFFKSYACIGLARLYFTTGRYKGALAYLKLSENKYPEYYLCGNASEIEEGSKKIMFATCYEKLGYPDSAINVLLPYMFDYGWSPYETAGKELRRLLKGKYTDGYIANELRKAQATITIITDKGEHIPRITVFGKTIEMSRAFHAEVTDPANNKDLPVAKLEEVYQNLFTASRFYKTFVQ